MHFFYATVGIVMMWLGIFKGVDLTPDEWFMLGFAVLVFATLTEER
jgi:hypothetical protein